jgi:hypothetical protein
MTERLTTLLGREADTFEVPAAPAADILGAGRRLHRRRTGTIWGGAALAVAVVAGGSLLIGTLGGDEQALAPTAPPPVQVAWGAGDTVYVGTDGHPAQMPEVAQTLYYTSAGILVRTNKDGASDGGAPFHFQLVKADGTTTKLAVTLGEVVPSTDPTQPYLAWATMIDGQIQVVVHDVSTDQDVATVDVPGTFDWGGWEAPPIALAGDRVYVGTNGPTAVVNWRTGEATTSTVLPKNYFPEVQGGRILTFTDRGHPDAQAHVLDAFTGRTLLDLQIDRDSQVTLSPDGRFAKVGSFTDQKSFPVYDVDTGTKVTVTGSSFDRGWTFDDGLFTVQGDRLTVCSAATGECDSSPVPPVRGEIRYAGVTYES